MLVFKVLTIAEGEEYDRTGTAPLSPDDERDGYVHLSTLAQLPGTLERHFADHRVVRILAIELERLGEGLRWEAARDGELFPHFYGRVSSAHAVEGLLLARSRDGAFRIPPWIAG